MRAYIHRKPFFASLIILFSFAITALLSACATPQTLLSDNLAGSTATEHIDTTLVHSPVGSASLSWDPGDHTLKVKISLTGMTPNSTHPAHIHAGNCMSHPMGAIIFTLKPVVADVHGVGISTTVIPGVMHGIPEHGWYVNVHNGAELTTALQSRSIACGNVFNAHPSRHHKQSVQVTMAGTMSPDESVHGHAWLSIDDSNLAVKISVSGLVPFSVHMAHIHAGSCQAQGPVVYPLNMVVADGYGNATSTTIIKSVNKHVLDAKLYVNVHEAGTMQGMSVQSGFNPIACGNIAD